MTRNEHLLLCLAEECDEVGQRVMKALRSERQPRPLDLRCGCPVGGEMTTPALARAEASS